MVVWVSFLERCGSFWNITAQAGCGTDSDSKSTKYGPFKLSLCTSEVSLSCLHPFFRWTQLLLCSDWATPVRYTLKVNCVTGAEHHARNVSAPEEGQEDL